MKLKFLTGIAGFIFLAATPAAAQNPYGLPADIKDGNILHCFDWKMSQIKLDLRKIAEAGFNAIQISPVQRNVSSGAIWYDVYRPYDFKFVASSGLGSADDLKALCEAADEYGIKIIVDVVFNHVDKNPYRDSWWNQGDRDRNVSTGINYGNRYSITHHNLGGGQYSEVNSESAEVTARAKAYIEELKSYGVSGIRFDAAKHIALPSEGTDFWKEVTSIPGMFYYGEILGNPGGSNSTTLMKEYTDYMSVTDEDYSTRARNNMGVPNSQGNWSTKGIDAGKLVFWGESHDTYSNTPDYGGVTNGMAQNTIDKAYAILACRNAGVGLYFSRPTTTNTGQIKVGNKGTTHYADPEVAEVNKFKNAMVGKADSYKYNSTTGCVTRQGGGAVIVTKSGYTDVEIENGNGYCPPGTYYDRVSGNKFEVTSSTIKGRTGGKGIAVIYGDWIPGDDFVIDDQGQQAAPVFIYTTNPNNWSDVYVYLYTRDSATQTNGNWPGAKMTKKGNLWEYEVPAHLTTNTSVLFNNNNGSQYPGKIDGTNYDGYLLSGKSMINDGGTGAEHWKEYDSSGISDIFEDENFDLTEAAWYTLQGIRVVSPTEKGLYIVVSPKGQTKKVLLP